MKKLKEEHSFLFFPKDLINFANEDNFILFMENLYLYLNEKLKLFNKCKLLKEEAGEMYLNIFYYLP